MSVKTIFKKPKIYLSEPGALNIAASRGGCSVPQPLSPPPPAKRGAVAALWRPGFFVRGAACDFFFSRLREHAREIAAAPKRPAPCAELMYISTTYIQSYQPTRAPAHKAYSVDRPAALYRFASALRTQVK